MPGYIFLGLLLFVIPGGLLVLAVVLIVASARNLSADLKRQGAAWRQLAFSLGLQFEVYNPRAGALIQYEYPRLTGQYHGYPVRADLFEALSGTSYRRAQGTVRTARIVITLAPPAAERLAISDHAFGFMGGIVLTKQIPEFVVTTGDAAFDQAFNVISLPPAFGARVLADGAVRHSLLSAAGWLAPGLELKPGELRFEHPSTAQDTAYLPIVLDAMIELAKAVEHAG